RTLTSAGKDLQDNFLKALAVREEDNRSGKVSLSLLVQSSKSHHPLSPKFCPVPT
ncbi:unnamed protein product, partial [Gulo gulo]